MSFELILFTGIGTGLIGSLHCIGMCGPIAWTLTQNGNTFVPALLYNFGRSLSYALMGLILGLIGNQFFLAGMQQLLSIGSGIIILIIFIMNLEAVKKLSVLAKWNLWIQKQLAHLVVGPKGFWFPFELGVLNAWLPCGLVYLALMHAMASGSVWAGAGIMFFFGVGTLPLMFIWMVSGAKLNQRYRNIVQKCMPWFVILMASLLILRGLNLGIPYISPSAGGVNCH